MIDKFFDCLNVRSFNESIHRLKPNLRPYRQPDDDRLKVNNNTLPKAMCLYETGLIVVAQERLFAVL